MVLAMTAATTALPFRHPISVQNPLACINQKRLPPATAFDNVYRNTENPNFDKTDFSYMRTGIMAGSSCLIEIMQRVVDKMNMSETHRLRSDRIFPVAR